METTTPEVTSGVHFPSRRAGDALANLRRQLTARCRSPRLRCSGRDVSWCLAEFGAWGRPWAVVGLGL